MTGQAAIECAPVARAHRRPQVSVPGAVWLAGRRVGRLCTPVDARRDPPVRRRWAPTTLDL